MSFMNAYSKDLRSKALAAIDHVVPRREVQDLFGLSRSTIKRWLKRRRLTGDVAIHKISGRPSVKGGALGGETASDAEDFTLLITDLVHPRTSKKAEITI